MGLGFARTPYPKMHGLANKIDRVKNARTRIVQGSWIRVCVHAVLNLQGLATKIDRAKNAQTRIVQGQWD